MERKIEALLLKMTLEEKVGQMTELSIDLLQKRTNPFADSPADYDGCRPEKDSSGLSTGEGVYFGNGCLRRR